ncbi:PREDICTED: kelch domain-containing protein 9 isoform X3 [Galeopterus variegatus]|uniref:Kelch domain-containing protein 9 isoform X3 n=1 Tax=Galeopterus variegatus TaxID=482537 RepID=A0ABM0RCV5_GALVR|nr:PREDICTED: kelch domain-containing protein 9 isoform X3 [Galeopterus variegatus]
MAVAVPPGRAGGSGWAWRPVAQDALLARAFHSCTELQGRLYLVGGLLAGGAREPSSDTVVFDPAGGQAVRLGARGSPQRSHHDAAPVGGRWLCVVGGWDGSRRLATVAALDTERGVWEAWTATPSNCPPAGLSSHTCTRLSDRELRVAGREGSIRTQRRYGSIYTLRLDPNARSYCYKEEGCHTVSRSGHCAALLQTPGPHPGHQLLLFGGCNSAEPEVAGLWSHGKIKTVCSFSLQGGTTCCSSFDGTACKACEQWAGVPTGAPGTTASLVFCGGTLCCAVWWRNSDQS